MTVQASEGLIYEGKYRSLHSKPLEDYFDKLGKRPPFGLTATNNWRGYVGEWEIINGKLHLNRLLEMGLREVGTGVMPCLVPNKVSVTDIFPHVDGPVFASWYTGTLRCPQGTAVQSSRGEFGALYEEYQVLQVEDGCVIGSKIIPGIPTPETHPVQVERDRATERIEPPKLLRRVRNWLTKFL